MRRWMMGWMVVVALVMLSGAAQACMICGQSLACVWSPGGGRWCITGSNMCMVGGSCSTFSLPQLPYDELGVVQITIADDAPGGPAAPVRVARGEHRPVLGRHALELARGSRGGFASDDAIVFSGQGYTEGGTAVFRSSTGDGFTLAREAQGRGARVRVCALAGTLPGRVLADESLGEDDALVVRVPFEGRTRVLVLRTPTLPRAEAMRRDDGAEQALRDVAAGRPEPTRPPFELRVLDR